MFIVNLVSTALRWSDLDPVLSAEEVEHVKTTTHAMTAFNDVVFHRDHGTWPKRVLPVVK